MPTPSEILEIRSKHLGKRVRLIRMSDDPNPVEPGTMGTVGSVDAIGTLHTRWDNGRRLGLILGDDEFELIADEKTPLD